jgi:hypothetical protein
MNIARSFLIGLLAVSFTTSAFAQESGEVVVVKSQFTAKVESSMPVDTIDLAHDHAATYWVVVKNTKAPTHVTLVWKLDGKEVTRQSLDVGISPAWKTWGSASLRGAKSVEVDVLDESGNVLKVDTL